MRTSIFWRSLLLAAAAALALAPAALGDTCCANVAVGLSPRTADPGDQVTVAGIRCLHYDNSGPVAFAAARFYLHRGHEAADPNPGDVPGNGPGLPSDLPTTDRWPAFDSVASSDGLVGSAVLTVPQLRSGSYQLWWWCDDGSGPGGGIHYSDGPRLTISGTPDTDAALPDLSGEPADRAPLVLLGIGAAAAAGTWRFASRRRILRPNR